MIDFRYHVVSLVSVFLALAVGIVLGAGPLKGEIGDQLTSRVTQLADENADLTTQLNTTRRAVQNRDTFTRAVMPQLAGSQLAGHRVAVVTVPGVDADATAALTDTLKLAGATLTGRVDVTAAWTDPAHAADRDRVVREHPLSDPTTTSPAGVTGPVSGGAASVAASPPAAASAVAVRPAAQPSPTPAPHVDGTSATDVALAGLLARSVVARDPGLTGGPDQAATAALEALGRAGLVKVDGDLGSPADVAVLLVPAVQQPSEQPTASGSPSTDPVTQWSALAVALDSAGEGAVVTGPASSATSGGVLAAIRAKDALAKSVSTVDTGGTPMGDLTTVLALREQAVGGTGKYGFVGSVDAPMPQLVGSRS